VSDADHKRLVEDVEFLRKAVNELEYARSIDTTPEKLEELHHTVTAMAKKMDAKLDEIRRALIGNSGPGAIDILAGLTATVESMGRIIETLHREGHLKNEVIESLVPKLSMEKTWQSVALMWQSYAIKVSLTRESTA